MINKKTSRLRRAKSARARIRKLAVPRLSVHRTGQHLYAQVIAADGETVIRNAEAASVSFPGFYDVLRSLSA